MYNAGIVLAHGSILMFGDSDAMVRQTFIERIITSFKQEPLLVYHMDEFRNVRRDFYPFNFPSFEEVSGDGCINNVEGKTKGVLDTVDPIHTRNYGACMCARRDDVIAIGGADEDLSYLGHVCGPYDMTFRLMNFGRRLHWETEEYLYHTWHPGTDGTDNYLGPHDGMNMSTTALQALSSGRVLPLVENAAVRELRNAKPGKDKNTSALFDILIDPQYKRDFSRAHLGRGAKKRTASVPTDKRVYASYKGFNLYKIDDVFYAVPESLGSVDPSAPQWQTDDRIFTIESFAHLCQELDNSEARLVETTVGMNICAVGRRYALVPQALGPVDFRTRRQRTDPRIIWTATLEEARSKAVTSNDGIGSHLMNGESAFRNINGQNSGSYPPWVAVLVQEMSEFERRLAQLEKDVLNIYRSRIWRTLTWIGGLIDALTGRTGPRK